MHEVDAIPTRTRRKSIWIDTLYEFVNSPMERAAVNLQGRSIQSAYIGLFMVARRRNLQGVVKIKKRGGGVYLEKVRQ